MSDATNVNPTQTHASERIAYIIGWLVYELVAQLGIKKVVDE